MRLIWVYKVKRDGTAKARLCVQGTTLEAGVDYDQVYSAALRTERMSEHQLAVRMLDCLQKANVGYISGEALKEFQFKANIAEHDFSRKVQSVADALAGGHPTKVRVTYTRSIRKVQGLNPGENWDARPLLRKVQEAVEERAPGAKHAQQPQHAQRAQRLGERAE